MAWVYLLECADGSYYVASCRDIHARLMQHAAGRGARYTAKRLPVRLLWVCETERIDDAYVLERRLHGWSRRKRELLMRGEIPIGAPAPPDWSRWIGRASA